MSKAPVNMHRMYRNGEECMVDDLCVPVFEFQGWSKDKKAVTLKVKNPVRGYTSSIEAEEYEGKLDAV